MKKGDVSELTIVEKRALRKAASAPRTVRSQYRENLREYLASQDYAKQVQGYISELSDINQTLKTNNSVPFIGPDGLIQNENYIDLDSVKVRIVAVSKAIDSSLKMLDKLLPNAAPIKEEVSDDNSFTMALQEVEEKVIAKRLN